MMEDDYFHRDRLGRSGCTQDVLGVVAVQVRGERLRDCLRRCALDGESLLVSAALERAMPRHGEFDDCNIKVVGK